VWRIALGAGRSPEHIEKIDVGAAPRHVVAGESAVWVAKGGDGTVSRIDAATGEFAATIRVGGRPHGIAAGAGRVWVTVQPADPLRQGCTYP
jgi:YVTN family beta-propeller protein